MPKRVSSRHEEKLPEIRQLLVARIRFALLLGAALLPLFTVADLVLFQRRIILALTFLKIAQAVIMGGFYLFLRRRPAHAVPAFLVTLVTGAVSAAVTSSLTGDIVFIPLLAALLMLVSALIFPWGMWPQVATAVIWTGATLWNLVYVTGTALAQGYPLVVVFVIGIASVVLARQLELHRVAMANAETARREEAHISSCLARVGEQMISSLDTQVLMNRLCQLTTDVLSCDFSHTWRRDSSDDTYVPVAIHGETLEGAEFLRLLRLPGALVADLLARLERERIVDVPAAAADSVLSTPLAAQIRAAGITRSLYVALRRGEEVFGIHIAGYRQRSEPFTATQRRLAAGIAHLGSMALERARLVEELDRANRLKEHFVATMSHELKNPLGAIIGYVQLLLDEAELGTLSRSQADVIGRVGTSARHALDVIDVTLDMSRFESRGAPLNNREIEVPPLLTDLANEAQVQTHTNGVPLIWDTEAPLPNLQTDPVKLKMVLRNLIVNAMKFTEHGSVTVRTRALHDGVEFSVIDTGIGIPPEAQELIFEPFRQLQATGSRRHGGAGLGLYIVRRLADLLNATVSVESEPGRGSTFRVWVPREPPAEAQHLASPLR